MNSPFDIKAYLKNLTTRSGVYRMYDEDGTLIYIGKAKNLKNRVSSYFRSDPGSPKVRAMVAQIALIDVTVTPSEAEALILEHDLIKQHRPRYNILLRDDKSYPYIRISDDEFPRLAYHRGSRKKKGRFIGPYPNAYAVKQTLILMQKLFRVRQCEDTVFRNRTRPCLQYQINRCSAPCVGLVSSADYANDVSMTEKVLTGRSQEVQAQLQADMESAAEDLRFEEAAMLRNRLRDLRVVNEGDYAASTESEVDIFAAYVSDGYACVQVFYIRGGHHLGNESFFPEIGMASDAGEILDGFIGQFYLSRTIPRDILLSHEIESRDALAAALHLRSERKVNLVVGARGERGKWVRNALDNAKNALVQKRSTNASQQKRMRDLCEKLGLDEFPDRIECFDISHTQGEATVASCVVFGADGPIKEQYRRYNINGITGGDDYAAMRQVVMRRYAKQVEQGDKLPDLVLIDGGKGQISTVKAAFEELGINDNVQLVGVSKGPERRAGEENLIIEGTSRKVVHLGIESAALHLVMQIRDEAHRFAITGHRAQHAKARVTSTLEAIPKLGPKRRQALVKHFGGIAGVKAASAEELSKVQGISRALADDIFAYLHGEIEQ
ncbi:MAG: excinuclease ABC subunit UvrC [Gammaproteobacteria bacterium]|nr:excinuclease ABC subunit UvrC [Gammaproteobacteria bacterium]